MSTKFSDLFNKIENHAVVITPNRRIAADLLEKYNNFKIANKYLTWNTPTILPIEAYLYKLWDIQLEKSIDTKPLVLKEEQELIIWETIIKKSTNNLLFNHLESARIAKDTNDLINQWNITIEQIDLEYSPDCQQFIDWHTNFKSYLNENGFIESSLIPSKLAEYIQDLQDLLPKKIIFAFFDEFIPIILKLKNCLAKYCDISSYEQQEIPKKHFHYVAKNTEEELIDLVCWARNEYLANKSRIACVVTDLTKHRNTIEKIAKEYLHVNEEPIPYDISTGRSLIDYPIINTVFRLLAISEQTSINLINEVLSSPFIKGAYIERNQRMTLIRQINSLGILDIDITHLLLLTKDHTASYHCPIFSTILQQLYDDKTSEKFLLPSVWVKEITKILNITGWPGDQTINSEEYQVFKKFETVLTKFTNLDYVLEQISYNKAVTILENFSIKTEFQIQSPKTPIQFLGLLEAAGRYFDSIWITNVTSTTWPEGKRPNPFIPLNLQLKYNLPHSSYERELEFSKRMTNGFIKSASQVIFSYSSTQKDLKQYASPLIKNFPIYKKNFKNNNSIYLKSAQPTTFDYYSDNIAPQLIDNDNIAGGSEILRYQSECPFKAFARFRLDIKPDYQNSYGLSYLQRGILMHFCLEKIWQKLKTSENLIKLTKQELIKLISSYVDLAITKKIPIYFIQCHNNLIKLEKRRLVDLLGAWLEFEKKRKPFSCIAVEKRQILNLQNISMELRVDRIDRINNNYAVIDYKSTSYSGIDWFSDRPDSPQLLLYLISTELPISAIAFAQIKFGKTLFRGLSNTSDIGIEGITTDSILSTNAGWKKQKMSWRKTLESLLVDFKKGDASLDPKYITTCSSCHFDMLCRVNDQGDYQNDI